MKHLILIILFCSFTLLSEENDSIKTYRSNEIIILDDKFNVSNSKLLENLNSTEDILKEQSSVDLINRGNFAAEPVVRGYTQERLNITVDGMHIYSACVDKMDPISSYIDIENLSSAEISNDKSDLSSGTSTGGSINYITQRPDFNNELGVILENMYHSSSGFLHNKGKVQYAKEDIAVLGSFSIKNSDNYRAGNNELIKNSSYGKQNYKLDISYKDDDSPRHDLSYIYDNSYDVGYPALIMDTRKTNMHVISYDLTYKNLNESLIKFKNKLYYNYLSHLMDDFDRSKEEITNRDIMPGMYMPMYGETETFGINSKAKFLFGTDLLNLSLEAYRMNAFADMDMESVYDDEKMYLVNLGDIETNNIGLSGNYISDLNDELMLDISGRLAYINRSLNNDFAMASAESYWGSDHSINKFLVSTSLGLDYSYSSDSRYGINISRIERSPTHIENYSFYIYNISDNSIFVGNPNLSKETAYSINMETEQEIDKFTLRLNLFSDYLLNYIAGIEDKSVNKDETFSQNFKQFSNIGDASVSGFELKYKYEFSDQFDLTGALKYQYSRSFKYNEALPFTPPLSGNINISYGDGSYKGVISAEFADKQNNISKSILNEDATPGYVILNFRNLYKISDLFVLKFGVENIFDKFYYHHFSINNLPNPGRNIYLGLNFSL